MTESMLLKPEHCVHEYDRRQAVATTKPEIHGSGHGDTETLNVPAIFVVCLDCGHTEEVIP